MVILKNLLIIFCHIKEKLLSFFQMQRCTIPYIPNRLQSIGRKAIEKFGVGESLYLRCRIDLLKNPYKTISITELSHNRSGLPGDVLCNPDDVLYNILEKNNFEKYELEVCVLDIKNLNEESKYRKAFNETKNGQNYVGVIELIHEPEPCMYPHSVFRIWLNDEKVTYKNYKETLTKVHQIRNSIKEELASMIRQRQVSQYDLPI